MIEITIDDREVRAALDKLQRRLSYMTPVMRDIGQELAFSAAARDALLDIWPVLPAVVSAFIEAHSPEGRAKN